MENIPKIKDIVRQALKEDPGSRDSDLWLIINVLRRMGFKIYIDYKDIGRMPSLETITRIRRKIQNTNGEFLPSPDVDAHRNKKQTECRDTYQPPRW